MPIFMTSEEKVLTRFVHECAKAAFERGPLDAAEIWENCGGTIFENSPETDGELFHFAPDFTAGSPEWP